MCYNTDMYANIDRFNRFVTSAEIKHAIMILLFVHNQSINIRYLCTVSQLRDFFLVQPLFKSTRVLMVISAGGGYND